MPYRYRFSNPPRSRTFEPALPAEPIDGKWLTSFPSAAHMSCGDRDKMHTVSPGLPSRSFSNPGAWW